MRRWLTTAGLALGLATALVAPADAAIPPAELSAARLSGGYQATGTITQAVGVAGERPGETVIRGWVFTSPCASSACPLVELDRQRGNGIDHLFLRELRPGVYFGRGAFLTGARCKGRTYARGLLVPYTISLTVTGVAPQPDGSTAVTSFSASYANPYRIGLTRCYSAPSHDAARYTGVSSPAA